MKYVFVGGLHRSGTTTLGSLIARSCGYGSFKDTKSLMDEGQRLQSVLPTDQAYGGIGELCLWYKARGEIVDAGRIDAMLREWAIDPQARGFVEKSPINFLRIRALAAALEDAHFFVIVRHPMAVLLASQKWSRVSPALCMANCRCHFREVRALMQDPALASRVTCVHYERLDNDYLYRALGRAGLPHSEISPFRLDNTSYESAFQRFRHRRLPDFDIGAGERWANRFENAVQKVLFPAGRGSYRMDHELPLLLELYGEEIEAWGYSCESLGLRDGAPDLLGLGAAAQSTATALI
jgi:hypothetical protein